MKIKLLIQLLGTLAIIAFVPGNIPKWIAFWVLWLLTFVPLTKKEVIFLVVINVFFTIMNALSLKQGIFAFTKPDFLLMPYYEITMWGFYLLHTSRMLNGPVTQKNDKVIYLLAFLYSAAFGAIADQKTLFIVLVVLLTICLSRYHEKYDFLYMGYMIGLGALIEYTGVFSGEWSYPDPPMGGVPIWFVTLWGGVGFFLRRLGEPLFRRA